MTRIILAIFGTMCVLTLTACATAQHVNSVSNSPKVKVMPENSVVKLTGIADDVVSRVVGSMKGVDKTGLVAIATPVDIASLEQADWLGRELAEQFVHALHKRGFLVYEYKIKGWLEVTKDGDYVYSRNWQKLASKANVSRVLSGTLSRNDTGVMLYARLVNLKTQVVEGASEVFIPYSTLPKCYRLEGGVCANDSDLKIQGENFAQTRNIAQGPEINVNDNVSPKRQSPKSKASKVQTNIPSKQVNKVKTPKNIANKNIVQKKKKHANNSQTVTLKEYQMPKKTIAKNQGSATCVTCGQGSGTKSYCHKDCSEAVTYPASTTGYGGLLVRDASIQSQYDRK